MVYTKDQDIQNQVRNEKQAVYRNLAFMSLIFNIKDNDE